MKCGYHIHISRPTSVVASLKVHTSVFSSADNVSSAELMVLLIVRRPSSVVRRPSSSVVVRRPSSVRQLLL